MVLPRFKKRYVIYALVVSYIIVCQSCMRMRMSEKKTKAFFEKAAIQAKDSTITFGNVDIHYLQTGRADQPTLVFVHGSPGSWDAYKDYLTDSPLLKKYRIIAIDRPGFGHSSFGKAENLQSQASIIDRFITKIANGKPMVLVGHSMGGPVIVKLAATNPKKYQNLVVIAGAIDPNAEKPEKWRKVIMTIPLRYLIPGALRPSNDELWWLKADLQTMKAELKNITANITIIHGTKDQLVPYSNVQFMQTEFSNANHLEVIPIKDANHFIPWTHFEIIRNALLNIRL